MRYALPFALTLLGASTLASADTVGVFASVGRFGADVSGHIQSGADALDVNSDLGVSDEGQRFFSVAFEHPLPLLPNVKLARTDLDTSGTGVLNRSIAFDGQTFAAGSTVDTRLDLGHYDGILYYEVLDNWVSLDLGLDLKYFDGEVRLRNSDVSSRTTLDDVIPAVYARAAFELPVTGITLNLEGSGINYDGSELTDLKAGVMLESGPLVVEGGYRRFDLKLDDVADLTSDLKFDGAYLSVGLHL